MNATGCREQHAYFASLLLPCGPDRRSEIEWILGDLEKSPSPVEIVTPPPRLEKEIERYVQGTPRSGRIYRGMALDVLAGIDHGRKAELFLEAVTDEIVRLDFGFPPSTVRPPCWDPENHRVNRGDSVAFMRFLLDRMAVHRGLVGTLARDLLASDILGLEDKESFLLADRMSFDQLAGPLLVPGSDYQYDFAIIDPAASGAKKPLLYSLFGNPFAEGEADNRYLDLELLEDIRTHAARAEKSYGNMYESRRPKDDRDDALLSLAKAIGLAAEIGLDREVANLRARYDHINAVFDSQFRNI